MSIKIEVDEKEDKDKVIKSALAILNHNNLLTLSTFDKTNNQPCCSTAYYVFDNEFNLYFWTDPNALHSRNIKQNSKVGVNIFDSRQEWGSLLKGLQIFGTSSIVSKKELLTAGALYIKRFPNVVRFVKKILDFHSSKFQSKIYKIEINKIKVFDEETFGKEEFRELIIRR